MGDDEYALGLMPDISSTACAPGRGRGRPHSSCILIPVAPSIHRLPNGSTRLPWCPTSPKRPSSALPPSRCPPARYPRGVTHRSPHHHGNRRSQKNARHSDSVQSPTYLFPFQHLSTRIYHHHTRMRARPFECCWSLDCCWPPLDERELVLIAVDSPMGMLPSSRQ